MNKAELIDALKNKKSRDNRKLIDTALKVILELTEENEKLKEQNEILQVEKALGVKTIFVEKDCQMKPDTEFDEDEDVDTTDHKFNSCLDCQRWNEECKPNMVAPESGWDCFVPIKKAESKDGNP